MISCGVDLVADSRFDEANNAFFERVLCEGEPKEKISSIFAIKEAVSKALGIAPDWKKICVHYEQGKPIVKLDVTIAPSNYSISVSVSHENGFTIALVVLEYEQ